MPGPDLDAIADRAQRARTWVAAHAVDGWWHAQDVRTHFEVDVPALVREIRFLRGVIDQMGGGATEPGPTA